MLLLLAGLFAACRAEAYVTSATLECYGDDQMGFHLNGRVLLDRSTSPIMYNWYGCLSTSDGTLPLELFNSNADNLLAAENFDLYGGSMYCAYRLTVHQSKGDPIVIWGEAGKTKFFNILRGQQEPEGWTQPGFDDSRWGVPFEVFPRPEEMNFVRLEDDHFRGLLGMKGYVPVLSHNSSGQTNPMETDLYRSHFRFPNDIATSTLLMNPTTAGLGQKVAFRLVPGRDVADMSEFNMFAYLPQGLEPYQILNGGTYDKAKRLLLWRYTTSANSVKFISLNAESVLSAPGWENPEKALGPFKPQQKPGVYKPAPSVLNAGAVFNPELPAWFKMSQSGMVDGPGAPLVLGVIFHTQLRVGGQDNTRRKGVNQVFLNYSVDGSQNPALRQDVQISHAANDELWIDGYYDASEDRKWTWTDINNLKVRIQSRVYAERAKGRMASLTVIVRSFKAQDITSAFIAQVTSRACQNLEIKAGVDQPKSRMVAMDPFLLPVNQQLCAKPTPRPTPLPGHMPEPTPVPVLAKVDLGLGCLQSSPEPFKRGGAFIYFCLNAPAEIIFNVYAPSGALVRSIQAGSFRSGNNQLFFNGLDNQGHILNAGSYTYEIRASSQGTIQTRNSRFTKLEDGAPRY